MFALVGNNFNEINKNKFRENLGFFIIQNYFLVLSSFFQPENNGETNPKH